jgi:hypothetical protein
MAGSWTTIATPAPAPVATMLLLTDGTVLCQGVSTRKWYRYTPAADGSYLNGTWATMADSAHAPLYYASGVLRDGRVIVAGGEYDAGAAVWLLNVEMYDPQANTWTTLPNPPGWVRIGDAPGCVLPDGRFFLGQVAARNTAIYDPATNTWTGADDKINTVSEESWSLLYDGTVHAVDCSNPPNAEKYIIASNEWVPAGTTLDTLVDSISEIGASVLLPDGRIFVIGATNFTALYTPPPIANQVGTWARGPSIPQVNPGQPLGAVDAPACVLPNGKVLFTVGPITSPASFNPPTFFMEYDPVANSISSVPAAASSASVPYTGRMVMLPTGQVFYTQHTSTPMLYTPDLSPDPVWRPTITNCPSAIKRGRSFTLSGRQINGLTQCSYYGNDATNATNYPIVRLESNTSSDVFYCRTHTFSTMGLNTGTVVHATRVFVPSSVPLGSYCLRLVANGIATASCKNVTVTTKWFKELKYEIKEKLEILEQLKEIRDLTLKRVPDIVDIKGIREDIDIFKEIEEEWTRVVTTIAASVDEQNAELTRAFIGKEERPEVGTPEPEIEVLDIPRISAAEAKRRQEKEAFAEGDDRKVQMTELGEATHEVIHNISRSGGKVDLRTDRAMLDAASNLGGTSVRSTATRATAAKASAKKATAKKAPAKKTAAKKATRRSR